MTSLVFAASPEASEQATRHRIEAGDHGTRFLPEDQLGTIEREGDTASV